MGTASPQIVPNLYFPSLWLPGQRVCTVIIKYMNDAKQAAKAF